MGSGLLQEVESRWRGCARCDLADGRTNVVFGRAVGEVQKGAVLFVGEAPGEREDAMGLAFVGPAGQLLDKEVLAPAGVQGAFITNCVCCRPPGNRDPRPHEIQACLPRLEAVVEVLEPNLIVTVGRIAKAAVGQLETTAALTRLVSITHPAWYLRQGHPTAATTTKMANEVARLQRALSALRPTVPAPTDHVHEGICVGEREGRSGKAPLMICRHCAGQV